MRSPDLDSRSHSDSSACLGMLRMTGTSACGDSSTRERTTATGASAESRCLETRASQKTPQRVRVADDVRFAAGPPLSLQRYMLESRPRALPLQLLRS